ncbi:CBS domain containing protein [Desulforamulus reducens MI-1]|uniref:CBS domain containing protein n=1 Tax=Desulforamulus reducens (strain ATCC BAA-1160 / DSM 100696 / MI-1) TaxID=349161 RepID=A4J4P0_DESRM|nr:CBS domain-containing protein [Desulforamulus reducens]ABO50043.1 CBS domain containing protein [Desulforamulus reducens MI-1]
MISIREVMVPIAEYSVVMEHMPVKKAIEVLKKSFHRDENGGIVGHRSLLVTNKKGELVGIVTLRNILKAVLTKYDLPDNYLWIYSVKDSGPNMPVKGVMRSTKIAFVDIEDDWYRVIDIFLTKKVNSLPVVEKGKLVGVIRTIDVFGILGILL